MKVIIPTPPQIKVNGYQPICNNHFGRWALEKHQLYPYLDGSCRREPDFEHLHPSITALCRQGSFAPHLQANEVVVYISLSDHLLDEGGMRMVAILQVIKRCESHKDAAKWYRDRALSLPTNCMVPGNDPIIFTKTNTPRWLKNRQKEFIAYPPEKQERIGKGIVKVWDEEYLQKVQLDKWPDFLICRSIYNAVRDNNYKPPRISKDVVQQIFNKPKLTLRTANIINFQHLHDLGKLAGIDIQLKNEHK